MVFWFKICYIILDVLNPIPDDEAVKLRALRGGYLAASALQQNPAEEVALREHLREKKERRGEAAVFHERDMAGSSLRRQERVF